MHTVKTPAHDPVSFGFAIAEIMTLSDAGAGLLVLAPLPAMLRPMIWMSRTGGKQCWGAWAVCSKKVLMSDL